MTAAFEAMTNEIEQEAATTRRVLERVPEDKFGWKPHPKSMSLGQLAMHVATIPDVISQMAREDVFEPNPANFTPQIPKTREDILAALDSGVKTARSYLGTVDEASAGRLWRARFNGREVMAMPRAVMLRALLLNHWYHHRGQLSVYLRLLDVPVPSIYGPSADDNPFA